LTKLEYITLQFYRDTALIILAMLFYLLAVLVGVICLLIQFTSNHYICYTSSKDFVKNELRRIDIRTFYFGPEANYPYPG